MNVEHGGRTRAKGLHDVAYTVRGTGQLVPEYELTTGKLHGLALTWGHRESTSRKTSDLRIVARCMRVHVKKSAAAVNANVLVFDHGVCQPLLTKLGGGADGSRWC